MANPNPKHKFSSSNQPPPRGKSYRTVLLEALRAANTPMNEIEFVTYYINKAMTCEDAQATGMLREIFLRLNPIPKPVAPLLSLTFPLTAHLYRRWMRLSRVSLLALFQLTLAR